MAWSLQWYQNSVLAWMWDPAAQQAIQKETPWFDMFANVKTDNVAWMDMLSPTERQAQQYDSNRLRAEALNKEVEIWLGSRIDDVMSDAEKQRYLNNLTKSQYQQMLKYKNEGYWFMASKELLENQYKLSDPNAAWIMKYKDYAGKDVYYNNNADTISSSLWDKYVANPIWWLARYWNETLGYGEDAQNGNMSFADKFANLTLGNIINWLDAYAKAESRIMNTTESWVKALYDRVVKGYDTDFDFYDKDREEKLVDEVIDAAFWAWQSAMWAVGLMPWAAPFTAVLSTTPWEVVWGLTLEWIAKWADLMLDNTPLARQAYRYLSPDSQDKLTTWLAMVLIWRVAKWGKAKLEAKATPYLNAAKWIIRNWLEKGVDYAKAQAWFEEFSKVKWRKERWDWTFVETENYNPWYRGRVAKEFWEWFKEWVKEKYNNPDWTNLSEFESTVQQWEIPWVEKTTSAEVGNKSTVENTQQWGIVNTIWTSQLRQWNKMNKSQAVKFFNKYGTDYGNWMAQRWFNQSYDNNINALWDYAEYVQGQKADVLGTIRQRYRDPRVDDMLSDALAKAEYIKSPDLSKIESLVLKNSQGWLTPQDVDWVRQWFGYNVPLRFDGTDVSGTVARNNNIYTAVREFLEEVADENGFSQLRDLNREIAATHHIIEATTRYYNWVATNDTVSLKDLVTLAWAMANPKARPVVIMQQIIKVPSVQDAILKKLIKGKTTTERNQIKIDLDKIKKIQDEAEQRRMLEEWIAKWNLKVEEATKAMNNRLPENITQWGVVAWDKGIVSPNPSSPTYQEMGLGTIRETASPQYLLRAIVEQLKQSNLIKDLNTAEAVADILSNLSPEAQAKLATISQKLASWQPLTAEEGKIIEKVADVIRHDWLDNPEGTDINNTNLPTNPTNNGGNGEIYNTSEPWMREGWYAGTQENWPNNENEFWWVDRWWNQEIQWGDGARLWEGESVIWKGEEVVEITNVNEALDVIDSILDRANLWKVVGDATLWDAKWLKTYTNSSRNAAVSVNKDWAIVEYVQADDAPKWAADELIINAIDNGANKITVDDEWLVEHFEKYWFRVVWRTRWFNHKFFMIHNWDAASTVRWKLWKYIRNVNLYQVKTINPKNAKRYMNKMLKENIWYKLENVDWWDWLQNYDNFGENFKTPSEIADYVLKSFRSLKNETTQELFDTYNKELLEAKEIYNWHIDTSDLNIVYLKYLEDAYAKFSPIEKAIEVWETDWFTLPHEYTHYNDRKFFKELTWKRGKLSDLAHALQEHKKDRPSEFKNIRQELVWDFVDIYSSIEEWWYKMDDIGTWSKKYWVKPTERMARRWEAFVNAVKWWEPISTRWEQFTNKLVVKYAEWLGKMDRARVNWDLHDGSLYWEYDWADDTFRRWYHWSPASFDKFDSTHMWEWEWNQAHWWGHYIAIEERTWKHYAQMGSSAWTYKWEHQAALSSEYWRLNRTEKDYTDRMGEIYAAQSIINDMKEWMSFDDAKQQLKDRLTERTKSADNHLWKRALAVMDNIKEGDIELKSWQNLYDVEVPDPIKKDTPTGGNYLEEEGEITTDQAYDIFQRIYDKQNEWLKPIKDATLDDVRKIGEVMQKDYKYADDIADRFVEWVNERLEEGYEIKEAIEDELRWYWSMASKHDAWLRDAWLYQEMERTWRFDKFSMAQIKNWRQLYNYLSHFLWWPKLASEALNDIWYDWIHYFWGRDWEAYVIFNDDAIDIVDHRTL